jgi:3-methyladenine DNA glycosylase AlkD
VAVRPGARALQDGSIAVMSTAGDQVRPMLEGVADPGRAPAMSAYMKDIAPFLGVSTPARRATTRDWIREFAPGADATDLLSAAHELVTEPEREFSYVAIDLVARHERALPESSLLALRDLALERPWWDTVDAWSTLIGRAGLRHRSWDRVVAGWAWDERLWVRRISLVFQVGRRDAVDLDLLFAACRANLADPDFFMRKGIGWGLRDAARARPDQVRAFVAEHRDEMSGLSIREATKHL